MQKLHALHKDTILSNAALMRQCSAGTALPQHFTAIPFNLPKLNSLMASSWNDAKLDGVMTLLGEMHMS